MDQGALKRNHIHDSYCRILSYIVPWQAYAPCLEVAINHYGQIQLSSMFVVVIIILCSFVFLLNLRYRREFDNLEDSLQRELGLFNVMTTSVKISEVGFPPRKYIPLSGHHQDKSRQHKPT